MVNVPRLVAVDGVSSSRHVGVVSGCDKWSVVQVVRGRRVVDVLVVVVGVGTVMEVAILRGSVVVEWEGCPCVEGGTVQRVGKRFGRT